MREIEEDIDDEFIEEPIPAKRDIRIFQRKKEDTKEDDEFEEDIFV